MEPNERPPFSFRIEGLGIKSCVIKVKKIACKSLKGRGVNSGLRLIYSQIEAEKRMKIGPGSFLDKRFLVKA